MRPVLAVSVAFLSLLAACASRPASAPTPSTSAPSAASSSVDPDATCPPKPPDPTRFPLDPVELVAGRETAGDDAWTEHRGAYAYVFANAANLAMFRADPARYEIQLGGACARMGPLSGDGNVTLHAVHDGRLYLFASKACRTAFVAAPEKYLEVADPAPDPALATPEARARGAEILAKALEWMGGAQAVDSVRTLVEIEERDEKSGDRTYRVKRELQLDFEHGWARENECWDASCFGNVIGPKGAFSTGKEWKELVPVQRAAFERDAHRGLLATLRRRNASDAIVYAAAQGMGCSIGPDGVVGQGVSGTTVAIWTTDTESRINIRNSDGAIAGIEHVGRGPNLARCEIYVLLDDWRASGPIRLPFRRLIQPTEQKAREVLVTAIEVDRPLEPALFQP